MKKFNLWVEDGDRIFNDFNEISFEDFILTEEQKQFVIELRNKYSWRMVAQKFAERYGILEPVTEGEDDYSQLDGQMLCEIAGID